MSASKHFNKIAWTVTAIMLALTMIFMNGAFFGIEVMAREMGYESRLFDNTRVHTIDIVMNDWDEFIVNAESEEYYAATVVIDGEAYKNVGIRGKGNTSLSSVSSMGSRRYSFKIEFDQYDDSISYHGLDKLSLNNLIQDSTMMKDYLTYTMMNEFGAAAPLCSFVYITVNGEDWGLYLAVEGVEDAFLTRNYGSDYGELYKPDSLSFGGGRGNGKDFDMNDFDFGFSSESSNSSNSFDPSTMYGGDFPSMSGGTVPEGFEGSSIPDDFDSSSIPEDFDMSAIFGGGEDGEFSFGGMGGFGMGSSDVKLQYIDDDPDSYSNIWNNAKTDITETDQTRLIESIKKLSNGEQIESVVDIEQVIRYFVVHNYVCNGDSYTGSMIHNYYLYEEDGQMSMIPWDYNLAYGTFQGGNGNITVNTPIDAPISGGSGEDRPMWYWILSDDTYTEMYHQYYAEFLNTVDIQAIIDNAYNLIGSYVEKDPTAFFTYEEFEKGVETMRAFCELRSESITIQLENGETKTNMSYVDASGLTLSDMGSMGGGMGGNMPNMNGDRGNFGKRGSSDKTRPDDSSAYEMHEADMGDISGLNARKTSATLTSAVNLNGSNLPEGFDPSQMQGNWSGQIPEDFDPSQMPGDFSGQMPEGFDPSQMPGEWNGQIPGQSTGDAETTPSDTSEIANRPSRDNMQTPSTAFNFNASGNNLTLIWLTVSVLILGAGLIVAKLFRY